MSLIGMILDVSQSMRSKLKSTTDEKVGQWAQSVFEVIKTFVKDDTKNRVFAIGVGALGTGQNSIEIFDVIGTVKRISAIMEAPATEDTVNDIFDTLERNGARNIRIWARDVKLIQKTVSDYASKIILLNLREDEDFLWTFVHDILPHSVRDKKPVRKDERVLDHGANQVGITRINTLTASLLSRIRPATEQDIKNIVEKAKSNLTSKGQWTGFEWSKVGGLTRASKQKARHSMFSAKDASCILKEVELRDSIFSVEDAWRIIHGYVGETRQLSSARQRKQNVELFLYGLTPLYQSLKVALMLLKGETCKHKVLFVLSDGEPTDGKNDDTRLINQITSELKNSHVHVVACFITRSTDIQPKRLYDKVDADWEPGAKFLFSLSSEVPTQHLPLTILAKREWTLDITNNETKLFIQINHPDNLR